MSNQPRTTPIEANIIALMDTNMNNVNMHESLANLLYVVRLESFNMVSLALTDVNDITSVFTLTMESMTKVLAHVITLVSSPNAQLCVSKGIVWVSPTEWHELRYCAYPNDCQLAWHGFKVPPMPSIA